MITNLVATRPLGSWFPWLLTFAVAWGALAFGAVYPWAFLPLAVACAVLGIGVLLAVVAVVQAAAIDRQDPRVYGFWRPQQITLPFGPFINRNHFAGWMVMALPLSVGYSLAVFQTSERPHRGGWRAWLLWVTRPEASRFALVAFSILAMGTSIVLSTSRSGMASAAAALAVLGVLAGIRGHTDVRKLAGIYLLVLVAGALAWAGFGATVDRFAQSAAHLPARVLAWRDTLRIFTDFPVAGVGIGSFGTAMLVYQSFDRRYLYNQAHNDYLEVLAEGGLLVTIPVAIAAGLFLWRVGGRMRAADEGTERMWIRAGAVAGLAGIAVQSLVEFSLQMPGNAVLFTVLAAIAAHEAPRRAPGRDPRSRSRGNRVPFERGAHDD
jgi:O-antigen ligase